MLASGSSGNVTFVSDGTTHLLIDLGLPCREAERRLAFVGMKPAGLSGVLLSHEHEDHARGALLFASRHRVPIYATEGTIRACRLRYRRDGPERHPVEWVRLPSSGVVRLGRFGVETFPTPHDAAEPVGFGLRRGRMRFAHVTDIGHVSRPVEEGLAGAHAILIESNYDAEMLRHGPYPESVKNRVGGRSGHLSNEALGFYLARKLPETVQHLFLAHLSRTNNHEALALGSCREALRFRGLSPRVHLAHARRPTAVVRLKARRPKEVDHRQGVLAF